MCLVQIFSVVAAVVSINLLRVVNAGRTARGIPPCRKRPGACTAWTASSRVPPRPPRPSLAVQTGFNIMIHVLEVLSVLSVLMVTLACEQTLALRRLYTMGP